MKRSIALSLIVSIMMCFSTPIAVAEQAGTPVAGDLTHLTYTATSGLWARILSPAPDSAPGTVATMAEVATGIGQGVEIRINGDVVPLTKLGKRVIDPPTGQTRYTFYGIPLQPGSNQLSVTPLGAGKLRGSEVKENVYGPGEPVAFGAEIGGKLVADGASALVLRVHSLDRWHHSAMPGTVVKAEVITGDVAFLSNATLSRDAKPADDPGASPEPSATPVANAPVVSASATPAVAATEAPVSQTHDIQFVLQRGGSADLPMISGLRAGDLVIRISYGNVSFDLHAFLEPALRAPLVVGLATVGMGSVPAAPGEDPTIANGANSRSGRVAIYGSGTISDKTLLTFAYDTADQLTQTTSFGAFGATDALANRPYDVVGDTSMTRDDALSSDHLYLRIDRGRSSLMWGEFQASTDTPDGGDGFNLLVDGAKAEIATSATKLTAFTARNNTAYARQIFSPLGLSTLGKLLSPNIVVGSDIVMLVTLDRHTGAILQQTQLNRNVDYTLNYDTGELTFINIPLPFDQNFNPQQIVVQYEYDATSGGSETTGGRFDAKLGKSQKTHLGAGYVNDAYGSGNYSLLTENIGGVLPNGTWSIEHLSDNGTIANDQQVTTLSSGDAGSALRAAFHMQLGFNRFSGSFDSTSLGFDNPFDGLSTPGLMDYHLAYAHMLHNQRGELDVTYDHERNSATSISNATSQSQAAIAYKEQLSKRFGMHVGVTAIQGPGETSVPAIAVGGSATPTPAPVAAQVTTMQADVGFDWKLLPRVDINVDRTQGLGSQTVASQPAQTNAELGVTFPKTGRAYIREIWSDAPTESFASSTISLTNPVSGTHSTAIGFQRALGAATSLTSEYDIQQTANGNDIFSSIGVDEKLELSKHLHGDAMVQRAVGIGNGAQGFNVYNLAMNYAPSSRFTTTSSYQLRTGEANGATFHLGAAGAISPTISLLGSINDTSGNGFISNDSRMGLAYRPATNDRGVLLVQYEAETGNDSTIGIQTDTLSLDGLYRPSGRLELAGRYAYKLDGDVYYPARTQLFGARAVQRIGEHLDIGVETSYLDVRDIPGASATGFALESGVRLGDDMRLAVGYNFSGAPDPALAAAPTRRGIYVTMTSMIDRILGWGR